MPKETIRDDAGMYDIRVGWSDVLHGGTLQVGIESADGRPIAEHLVVDDGCRPPTFTGLWGTFDRASVNRLIRALRRARDQAFGPDA